MKVIEVSGCELILMLKKVQARARAKKEKEAKKWNIWNCKKK